ncbi:hypothetical protein [Serratia ureilytica]|uniref:hypothetical protein n=1 Tax=Serratia ureilytica TaxID=300181 RepID=UPI002576368B|nr:hypothetical protein [Serratia ureilytica]MDM1842294.1 hypothetical protein [Serratia ureilytica]
MFYKININNAGGLNLFNRSITRFMGKLLNREVHIITLLTVALYAFSYLFQQGYASFYGFPDEFISFDLSILLRSAVAGWLLFFSFSYILFPLLDGNKPGIIISIIFALILYVVIMLITFGFGNVFYGLDSIAKAGRMHVIALSVFPVSLIFLVRRISVVGGFLDKIGMTSIALGVIAVISYSSGWVVASRSESLYLNNNGYYLLASYSDKAVLGKCINHQKEFTIQGFNDVYSKVDSSEVFKLKECFLKKSSPKNRV